MDAYIRQGLKNWAAEQEPPANLRTRVLLIAASPLSQQMPRIRHVDEYGCLKPFTSEVSFSYPRFDPFKQSWFLAFHSALSPLRHLP